MTDATIARPRRGGTDARALAPDLTAILEPADRRDPPPFPAGKPYEWNLCAQRTPPMGWEFLGAQPSAVAWVLPCPACQQGWVGLRPDGEPYGYVIAYDLGCTR